MLAPLLLGLLWRSRPRRILVAALAAAAVIVPVAAQGPEPQGVDRGPERPVLAYLGVTGAPGADQEAVRAISEFIQSEVVALDAYQVLGRSEIQALLGLEAERQLLGCAAEEASCMAEIGGALGAGRLMVGNLSRVGHSLLLNLSLLDVQESRLIHRVGKRVKGDTLEPILDVVPQMVRALVERDPQLTLAGAAHQASATAQAGLPPARPPDLPPAAPPGRGPAEPEGALSEPPAKPPWRRALTLSLRVDLEPTEPGGAMGVSLGWQPGPFGLSITALGHPPAQDGASRPFALRLEGRIAPFEFGPARPYLAAGSTLFLRTVLSRVGLGLKVVFGRLALEVDAAWERVLTDTDLFTANVLVLGFGIGWVGGAGPPNS